MNNRKDEKQNMIIKGSKYRKAEDFENSQIKKQTFAISYSLDITNTLIEFLEKVEILSKELTDYYKFSEDSFQIKIFLPNSIGILNFFMILRQNISYIFKNLTNLLVKRKS